MRVAPVALAAMLVLAPPSLAQPTSPDQVRVQAEGRTVASDCDHGGDHGAARLDGSRDTVRFTGACRELVVRGEGNAVAIALAPGARIDIEGGGNRVRYTLAPGLAAPTLRISGNATQVEAAPGAPLPLAPVRDAEITGDGQSLELDCAARMVALQGNRSRIVLRGGCAGLVLRGDGNAAQAEMLPGAPVLIEGNATVLSYAVRGEGDVAATVRGTDSAARRVPILAGLATQVAPVPPVVPMLPRPVQTVPVLMHDLRGEVQEPGTAIPLAAGLLFDPGAADLRLAAAPALTDLAQLAAQVAPSGLVVTARDPDPDLARRRAFAVRDWLAGAGHVKLAIEVRPAAGPPGVEVMILR